MEENHSEKCECDKPEIKDQFQRRCCSLNQIIKCHGDQPVDELLKHIDLKKDD